MKLKRTIAAIATAVAIALMTTGCIKLNMDLTVDKNDTVSGTIVFAVAKSLSEYANESATGESNAPATDGLLKNAKNVKVEKFDDGDFVGSSYSFESVALEEMTPAVGDNSTFGIARVGDNLVVSGVMDFSSGETTDSNPFADAMMASFAATTDIKISVTLPGEIKDSTGDIDGQTITWKGRFGKKLELDATSYSPLTPPINWVLIGGISAGVIIVTLTVALMSRRGKKSSAEVVDLDLSEYPK